MNRKQNVLEICCYIVALTLLLLYSLFGKLPKNTFEKVQPTIEAPIITDRVQ